MAQWILLIAGIGLLLAGGVTFGLTTIPAIGLIYLGLEQDPEQATAVA